MSKKGKIKLDIGTRSFYMDGVKRSGGYIQEETKAVNGILRNISGKAAEIFQFSGRIAPSDKAYAWAALSENGGKAINFTADGVLYSGYGWDISEDALKIALGNVALLDAGNVKIEYQDAFECSCSSSDRL